MPGWVWLGGLLGALYVVGVIYLAPRLGAATMIGFIVTGQLLTSLLLDHFGVVGFPLHPVNGWRILGALLLVTGVILIRRF